MTDLSATPEIADKEPMEALVDLLDELEHAVREERLNPTGSNRGIIAVRTDILILFDASRTSERVPREELKK